MTRRSYDLLAKSICLLAAMLVTFVSAPARAASGAADVIADFEGSVPAGFFVFSGASTVDATQVTVADTDPLARPGQTGNNGVLEAAYNVTDFGGFGDSYEIPGPQDWSGYEAFDFWFYGTGSGLAYQAEISDNRSDPATDTSERFDYQFVDDTAGWRYISIPFADFTRATDFQPAGAPDDGFTLTEIWAWAIILPLGADTVAIDDVGLGLPIIDDFESGLPTGTDGDGVPIGFWTFQGAGSGIGVLTSTTPPAPILPAAGVPNNVLQVDVDATSFAGVIHTFENAAVDTWVSQDWSTYEGIRFWLYGTNSGSDLFIDLLENRNPGSTTDDAERWTVAFVDDFTGWQLLEFPFDTFTRKEIGNGAPNDGLTLFEMHGWAFGTLDTGGPLTYYIDSVALYGTRAPTPLFVSFALSINDIDEGTTGDVAVKLSRPFNSDDPAQVSIDYATESASSTAVAGRDYLPTSGTFFFFNGGPIEQTFSIETFDNTKFAADKRIALRLTNPVDVERGSLFQASAIIRNDDPFDPNLLDDFEQGAFLWQSDDDVELTTPEIAAGDPLAVPGQGAFERVLEVFTPVAVDIVVAGNACNMGNGVVPIAILTTDSFDATTVDHTTVRYGNAAETHSNKKGVTRHEEDFDGDGDIDLVFHFRAEEIGGDCDAPDIPLVGSTYSGQPIGSGGNPAFGRDFALGQDWTGAEALNFWFYGTNSGDEVTVTLKDNRAPDPGPSGWSLVWSDEFDTSAGTRPDPNNWSYDIGDVTPDGKNGWGNDELQYYTDDPANAATDGNGNLVITVEEADGAQECFYGPCEYTSARLTSQYKVESAFGRIEARIRVAEGVGLWSSFWSLGADIDLVRWPQAGEIDFGEFVGRLPNEIFGTIQGPGYSGGGGFGGLYDFGVPAFNDYHTFTVEWEPDEIRWFVDGIRYHTATPADVPGEWVFNDPFFLLLNLAAGGNFAGPVDPGLVFPQSMLVDYVRVYQGPDTAERFETSFVDNFAGWQQVVIPFTSFTRSADQPAGAPDDGLGLSEVWGYGFSLPEGGNASGVVRLDQVRLQPIPPPTSITVATAADSGAGSLREAIAEVADGGIINFDPALAGATIALTTGPLVPQRSLSIDGSDAPGLILSGDLRDRVLLVDSGLSVDLAHLTVTNGFGFQLGGGILNNGDLTLDHVTVANNTMVTDVGQFWQGGAGIYVGEGGSLSLIDSTVSDNDSGYAGGGIYAFFNTEVTITRSTISGNLAQDVGGGLRSLGNVTILNSTLSGNVAIAFHGGAAFLTDGVTEVMNSTIADNSSPGGTAGGFFVGTFTASPASLSLKNSVVSGNTGLNCFAGFFGAGAVSLTSAGYNIDSDGSCNLIGTGDQPNTDPLLGPLADNGGPTSTHALAAGSPAIDSADAASCPATDQRGVARPQGAGCDVGAFELTP
jgi:beta-glucanase (GH16 family)